MGEIAHFEKLTAHAESLPKSFNKLSHQQQMGVHNFSLAFQPYFFVIDYQMVKNIYFKDCLLAMYTLLSTI